MIVNILKNIIIETCCGLFIERTGKIPVLPLQNSSYISGTSDMSAFKTMKNWFDVSLTFNIRHSYLNVGFSLIFDI